MSERRERERDEANRLRLTRRRLKATDTASVARLICISICISVALPRADRYIIRTYSSYVEIHVRVCVCVQESNESEPTRVATHFDLCICLAVCVPCSLPLSLCLSECVCVQGKG